MGHQLAEFTDKANCSGVSSKITIAPSAIVELKVGALPLEDREFVEWQALDTGLKWGLVNSVAGTEGDAFKSQIFTRPYGPNVKIYLRNSKASAIDVFIVEVN